jgi:hypothetical protein
MWYLILLPILVPLWFIDHARQDLGFEKTSGLGVVIFGIPISLILWVFILYEIFQHVKIS